MVHLVAAGINLSRREREVKEAVEDVRRQLNQEHIAMFAHIWDSDLSAGSQIADYGLWALQRTIVSARPGHCNSVCIKDEAGVLFGAHGGWMGKLKIGYPREGKDTRGILIADPQGSSYI